MSKHWGGAVSLSNICNCFAQIKIMTIYNGQNAPEITPLTFCYIVRLVVAHVKVLDFYNDFKMNCFIYCHSCKAIFQHVQYTN